MSVTDDPDYPKVYESQEHSVPKPERGEGSSLYLDSIENCLAPIMPAAELTTGCKWSSLVVLIAAGNPGVIAQEAIKRARRGGRPPGMP